MIRDVVHIDEELCDGCGLCVPACHEGAIKIVDGKARLVADNICDGLGACLGHCPKGAIRIEKREADPFDESAVDDHLKKGSANSEAEPRACPAVSFPPLGGGGCPGSRLAQFVKKDTEKKAETSQADRPSELTHWPVQLRLLPPNAAVFQNAKLLIAADCVPVAYADFHEKLLRDRAVVIACPKLDDTITYVDKLEAIIRNNNLREISVVRMEVPCCSGIMQMVMEAHMRVKSQVPLNEIVVSTQGEIITRRVLA